MKNLLLFTVIISLFASCSTSRTFNNGMFQKRKYNKGFYFNKKSNIHINHKQAVPELIISKLKGVDEEKKTLTQNFEAEQPTVISSDTVKFILKNGEVYIGILVEEDDSGYSVKLKNGRVIYLNKSDIKEIITIEESKKQKEKTIESEEPKELVERIKIVTVTPKKKELPKQSQLAITFGGLSLLALFIGLISISGSYFGLTFLAFFLFFCAFIAALILALVGHYVSKKYREKYDVKKANAIKLLFLIPTILFILSGLFLFISSQ